MKYAGADWVKDSLEVELSPLGNRVADLLGQMYLGIYHLRDLDEVDWKNDYCIDVKLRHNELSTFDNNTVTRLVILCHDMALRCQIQGRGPATLLLTFHHRLREGAIYQRHPTMEEAVEQIRAAYAVTEPSAAIRT